MEVCLNFYSKIVIFSLSLFSLTTHAMDIKAVYLSSCKREVGVITKSATSSIEMFSLKGKSVKVPRYEIVGISSYPLENFPVESMELSKSSADLFYFKTKYKKDIVPLVTGWPVTYSKNKISVLSVTGEEIPFSRDSIWDIEIIPHNKQYKFTTPVKAQYNFLHPVGLRKCPVETYGRGKRKIEVAPQEFISDPVEIKRRLDTIKREKSHLNMYVRSKDFYSVPQVYENKTTLGLWLSGNSRHGASENRSNNWAPILENQFSSGPYGYQHVFLTGAAENMFFVHEEPQTQFYYRFKADYFHLAYFMDPTGILMGKKYRWFDQELSVGEYRANDMSFIELGFDYGLFSLILQQSSEVQIGYKESDSIFYDGELTVPKIGFEFRNHRFGFNVLFGGANENVRSDDIKDANGDVIGYKISEFTLDVFRFNYFRELNDNWKFDVSYISRNFKVEEKETLTSTYYLSADYRMNYKYIFKIYISDENVKTEEKDQHFLKLGLNANLVF
jgi:hypothetical protein